MNNYERITAAIQGALSTELPGWRRLLTEDARAIITAASRAQAAADWLLARIRPAITQTEELAVAA